jgi:hypothetical protein
MNEQELRALVREAVARHLTLSGAEEPSVLGAASTPGHPSFHRYALPRGSDTDGPCLIEPKVRCNHCGYCQSHGF